MIKMAESLTDLIAAHRLDDTDGTCTGCDWTWPDSSEIDMYTDLSLIHPAHVALVVELHTDAVLDTGYHKPRLVGPDDLAALPNNTVIRGQWCVWEKNHDGFWFTTGAVGRYNTVEMLHVDHVPEWTVLYLPEEGGQ